MTNETTAPDASGNSPSQFMRRNIGNGIIILMGVAAFSVTKFALKKSTGVSIGAGVGGLVIGFLISDKIASKINRKLN